MTAPDSSEDKNNGPLRNRQPRRGPPERRRLAGGEDGPQLLNRQRRVKLSAHRWSRLSAFLLRLQNEVAPGRPFSVCVVSDAAMRRYNLRFRRKNAPTDVLAFAEGRQAGPAGDLLISAETARRQARRLGHAVETEIKILAIHGLLHLLGHDHDAPGSAGRMARAERRWRRRFALPQGLIERAQGLIERAQGLIERARSAV